ncbi:Rv2578c family radical SAM protein [Nocardiopsis sp. MG754419]|uniref:Rv2578c family radical SAM protein n=1 Tax=Nocardiopsis sp. MG754419 TaxID=2259865 RepID=UPI001BA9DD8A|nr:Rv2578c family radical SAM protein [Nocardiopsis sp. MG754419]MBR8743107.1 radical SAM protein [Nocardiopsis sp. MG754419]
MRWENLREDGTTEQTSLFEAPLTPPDRGTGRAGLATPSPDPIRAGQDGEALAIEIRARSIINRVPGADPMFRWTINPYRGCAHACVYCFARRTHEYLDLDSGRDFDTRILVKTNAGELLRAQLARPSWRGEHIAMGTNTDPYQRAEGHYRLMPQIIAALRDAANPFSILTKGTMILRDLDLLEQAARVTEVGLAVSVGSVDDEVRRTVEPGTPSARARLGVVRRLSDRGLTCSVLMAPILPGLTDSVEQIERTVAAIAAAGATRVTPIVLHLRPGAREWYRAWLEREHPRLLPLYRELYGHGSYARASYQRIVTTAVREIAARHGLNRPGSPRDAGRREPAEDAQLPLDLPMAGV